MLSSSCEDGIFDGKEDRRSQEKRWLPDSLGCIDSLLVGAVPEQGYSELNGDAAKCRDLVGTGATSMQAPLRGVVQLLHSEETKALDKCPFHLRNRR